MEYLYRKVFPPREGAEYQKKNPEKMQKNNKIPCCPIEHEDILKWRNGEHQENRLTREMHLTGEHAGICESSPGRYDRRYFFIFFHIFFISSSYFSSTLYVVSKFFSKRQPVHPPQELAATLQNISAINCKIQKERI
jgi:hypothetical protein